MRPAPRLTALLLFAALTATAAAQEADPAIFVERVDVDVVNVEVFVTDRAGRPVLGLTAEDFEVFEDGQAVEVTNFFTGARVDRVLDDLGRDLAELEGEPESPPAIEPLPEDQQLSLVVYVDHFNLRPGHRKRVLDDLEGFVEDRIIQGDRVMLVSHTQRLEVVEPFTRDRHRIIEALRGMGKVSAHRAIDDAERRRIMTLMTRIARDDSQNMDGQLVSAYQMLRSYVTSARNDLRFTAKAIEQIVRSLAGLPGRKALLYVSSGLAQRPGEDLYEHLQNLFPVADMQEQRGSESFIDPTIEALREDESHLFRSITRQANAHQVTLYTLDARGSLADSSLAADHGSPISPGGRIALDQTRHIGLQEPLVDMAATTGGKAILDTLNFGDALTGMGEDFDTFYSLGYRPPRGLDGKYHQIEVKTKRRGFKVRHRSAYESKPESERVADRTLSSLLLGLEKNPLDIRVEFGAPRKRGSGKFGLPVLIRIPIQEVTLLFQEASAEGRLHFYLVVQDEEGISDLHEKPYPVSIPSAELETARGREIAYHVMLKIRPGTPKIAVGVWDEISGVESFVQQRVLVEKETG